MFKKVVHRLVRCHLDLKQEQRRNEEKRKKLSRLEVEVVDGPAAEIDKIYELRDYGMCECSLDVRMFLFFRLLVKIIE